MENATQEINELRRKPFIQIPIDLLTLDLSHGAKLAFCILLDQAKEGSDGRLFCMVSNEYLSKKLNQTSDATKKQLTALKNLGLIERERTATRTGKAKTYITAFTGGKNAPSKTDLPMTDLSEVSEPEPEENKNLLGEKFTQVNGFTRVKNSPLLGEKFTQVHPYIYTDFFIQTVDGVSISENDDSKPEPGTKRHQKKTPGTLTHAQIMKGLAQRYQNPELLNAWESYLTTRKRNKNEICTAWALNLLINRLETLAHSDTKRIEIINYANLRGWKDFYPIPQQNKNPSNEDGQLLEFDLKGEF